MMIILMVILMMILMVILMVISMMTKTMVVMTRMKLSGLQEGKLLHKLQTLDLSDWLIIPCTLYDQQIYWIISKHGFV